MRNYIGLAAVRRMLVRLSKELQGLASLKWNRTAPIVGNEQLQTFSGVHKADIALTAGTTVPNQS